MKHVSRLSNLKRSHMRTLTGWFLDVYADSVHGGVTLWILGDDGERHRLYQRFPIKFYAGGPAHRLRALGKTLKKRYGSRVQLAREDRRDLLTPRTFPVLAIEVAQTALFYRIFREIERPFVDVDFYDTDIRLQSRHAAFFDVFPLTRCRVEIEKTGWVQELVPLESRWEPDPQQPPLRVMAVLPDEDPYHAHPRRLKIAYEKARWHLPLKSEPLVLAVFEALLRDYDPDVIVTKHGDEWLLPYLVNLSRRHRVELRLSRDPDRGVTRRTGGVFHTYGQVVRRGAQSLLHGRFHLDFRNTMTIGNIGLEGVFETARVGGLPVQTAARTSPGATLTSMKMITYLRRGIMVPNHKQQTEDEKDILRLTHSDKGGLIFPPVIGLHQDVVEVDFTSMFPAIARMYDISPETLGEPHLVDRDPRHGLPEVPEQPGILGETLAPMLEKRFFFKAALAEMSPTDPLYALYKERLGAHKDIGVVAYGRTKFRKETDGKVEVHEAITDFARKSFVLAKMTAESLGYRFLHGYVDALYLQKPGGISDRDVRELLDAIIRCTGLPIVLEGRYKWMAFLPSKRKPEVPAANKFFGVEENGDLKVRGIEARRKDTPVLIAEIQTHILEILAAAPHAADLPRCLPEIIRYLQDQVSGLRNGRFRLEELIATQKLSKLPEEYRVRTATVRAARQLHAAGKVARIGDHIKFVYVRGEEKVWAWDLPSRMDPQRVDIGRYIELVLRAAHTVLQMLGVSDVELRSWVLANAGYGRLPGSVAAPASLFAHIVRAEKQSVIHDA